ncbi:winged helix DNA-binding domain-containing protein [[Mycobacterium] manitobense]|nr:winged helix DNA-binding domain-containing protein [[Mycobacterium] manitobense]
MTPLSERALNRATLARQLLLQRSSMSALEALEHLVGMQAQAPFPPYYGLWSRLEHFTADELSGLLLDRRAARIVLMRGTIHLVSAADAHRLRPLVQPLLDRMLRGMHGAALGDVDVDAVAATAAEILETEALTPAELGARLAERWPDCPLRALTEIGRSLVPLVQVPPRALWQRSGQVRLTTAVGWLGPATDTLSMDDLVLRYLGAFGPASVADMQTWSGLTRLGEVFDRLSDRLIRLQTDSGRRVYDLPDAPRPDPDQPAPVRLVAAFDNLVLSHADRTRVISDAHRKRLFAGGNGVFPGTVLVDGFVAGTWELEGRAAATSMRVTPYTELADTTSAEVEAEGIRLLRSAFDAEDPTVSFSDGGA